MVNIVFLSGVSGAGKSTICHAFEERGYRIVENIPNVLLPSFLELCVANPGSYGAVVLVVDLRHARTAMKILSSFEGIRLTKILLDCSIPELEKRFRITRHVHPMDSKGFSLTEAMEFDAETMKVVRADADLYVDTTGLTSNALREVILMSLFAWQEEKMAVVFSSFGYKYGVPTDAELVFDCRILPNPYWVPELKGLSGKSEEVKEFLENKKETGEFAKRIERFLDFYLKKAKEDGKSRVCVYFGCSGGQHRSVYFAERFYAYYSKLYSCVVNHREMNRHYEIDDDGSKEDGGKEHERKPY